MPILFMVSVLDKINAQVILDKFLMLLVTWVLASGWLFCFCPIMWNLRAPASDGLHLLCPSLCLRSRSLCCPWPLWPPSLSLVCWWSKPLWGMANVCICTSSQSSLLVWLEGVWQAMWAPISFHYTSVLRCHRHLGFYPLIQHLPHAEINYRWLLVSECFEAPPCVDSSQFTLHPQQLLR